MLMATKLYKEVAASDEKILFIKSHKPLIAWAHQVT